MGLKEHRSGEMSRDRTVRFGTALGTRTSHRHSVSRTPDRESISCRPAVRWARPLDWRTRASPRAGGPLQRMNELQLFKTDSAGRPAGSRTIPASPYAPLYGRFSQSLGTN
jgi:hypothetical protein